MLNHKEIRQQLEKLSRTRRIELAKHMGQLVAPTFLERWPEYENKIKHGLETCPDQLGEQTHEALYELIKDIENILDHPDVGDDVRSTVPAAETLAHTLETVIAPTVENTLQAILSAYTVFEMDAYQLRYLRDDEKIITALEYESRMQQIQMDETLIEFNCKLGKELNL